MRIGVPAWASVFVLALPLAIACRSKVESAAADAGRTATREGGATATHRDGAPAIDAPGPGMDAHHDAAADHDAGACSPASVNCEFYTNYECDGDGAVSEIVDPCGVCGKPYWRPVHRCERGCRTDLDEVLDGADHHVFSSSDELCEENRPKKSGDPCKTKADCTPTTVTYVNGAYVPQEYLGCDGRSCVAIGPPVIHDWLWQRESCESPDAGDDVRVVASSACRGNPCLLGPATGGCRPQTCTAPCTGDQDCPVGAVCQLFPNSGSVRVCKPGYAGNDYSMLRCPLGPVDAGQ